MAVDDYFSGPSSTDEEWKMNDSGNGDESDDDPTALDSRLALGESEEEEAAAAAATRLSDTDSDSEPGGGGGGGGGGAMDTTGPPRRHSDRAGLYTGNMREPGVVQRAKRPTSKGINYKPYVKPTERMADRARNQANYLAHKRLATIDFLARATAAKEKLDVAHTNHYLGKRG